MLAKKITTTLGSAASRNQASFSVLCAKQEFAHKSFETRKPTAAKYEKATLDNGVRIVTGENNSPLVKVKFAVLGGSGAETFAQKGAAHLLGTNAFAGNAESSGRKIVSFLEDYGVFFTSSVDREKIVYEIRTSRGHAAPVIATVVSLLASAPRATEFENLKAHAQLHYDAFAANPVAQLNELIHEAAYGETSAFGGSLYAQNLNRLSAADVTNYRNATFVRDNIVIAAAGLSAAALKDILGHTVIGGIAKSASPVAIPSSPFVGGEVRSRRDLNGKTNLAVAFQVPAGEAGKAYGVLAEALRARFAEKTICAEPFINNYATGGLIGIRTEGSVDAASKNLSAALAELKAISSNAGDITGAKSVAAIDGVYRVDRQCTGVLLNAGLSNQDVTKAFDHRSVTADAVSQAAAAAIKSTPAYAVLGTTAGAPTAAAVQKFMA